MACCCLCWKTCFIRGLTSSGFRLYLLAFSALVPAEQRGQKSLQVGAHPCPEASAGCGAVSVVPWRSASRRTSEGNASCLRGQEIQVHPPHCLSPGPQGQEAAAHGQGHVGWPSTLLGIRELPWGRQGSGKWAPSSLVLSCSLEVCTCSNQLQRFSLMN